MTTDDWAHYDGLSEWWRWWYETHGGTTRSFPIVGLWTPEAIRCDQDFLKRH